MASSVFTIGQDFRGMCGEVPQVLSEVPTTGETRTAKPLGEQLCTISEQSSQGEKVFTWADKFTLGQAEGN
ncbi:MAG: hypothetical protein V7K20_32165 [Nostoc sp.]